MKQPLVLSRASSVVMLLAYIAYIFFQLKTHRQLFEAQEEEDISLGVALGFATKIAMFVVPLSVIVAWIMGMQMDLNFNLLETGSLFILVLLTAFTLQDPENKKIVVCDAKLKKIFAGKDRVGFLEISGLLNPHFLK